MDVHLLYQLTVASFGVGEGAATAVHMSSSKMEMIMKPQFRITSACPRRFKK